jgi:acyl-CoA synthetase (AMP-forming)/AMP-acid ligase II
MTWTPKTFTDSFEDTVETNPESVFIVDGKRRLTYREVADIVDRVAEGLIDLGVERGDRVSTWVSNCPEFVVTWLATARIGAVLVPMNTHYKEREAEYALAQSESSVLVYKPTFEDTDFEAMVASLRSGIDTLEHTVVIGDAGDTDSIEWADLSDGRPGLTDRVAERQRQVSPEDPNLIVYTSGTTGDPKGAVHDHNSILKNEERITEWMNAEPSDYRLSYLPPYHIAGSCTEIIGPMMVGSTIIFMEAFDPVTAMEWVESESVTIMSGIPTHYKMILNHERYDEFDLSSLRGGWVGGSAVDESLAISLREDLGMDEMVVVYGMTETISVTTFTEPDDTIEHVTTTDGKPISEIDRELWGTEPGFEVGIFDPETDTRLPAGGEGEIRVRGDIVLDEYFNMPEKTREAIDDDGWFHTGDRGILTDDGYLSVTGRIRDIFIVGGENVAPADVENYISTHEGVKIVTVVGVPHDRLGEVGKAYVETKPGYDLTEEEIIDYCEGEIAGFKIPHSVEFYEESDWPLTPTGKIQRFKLEKRTRESDEGDD